MTSPVLSLVNWFMLCKTVGHSRQCCQCQINTKTVAAAGGSQRKAKLLVAGITARRGEGGWDLHHSITFDSKHFQPKNRVFSRLQSRHTGTPSQLSFAARIFHLLGQWVRMKGDGGYQDGDHSSERQIRMQHKGSASTIVQLRERESLIITHQP